MQRQVWGRSELLFFDTFSHTVILNPVIPVSTFDHFLAQVSRLCSAFVFQQTVPEEIFRKLTHGSLGLSLSSELVTSIIVWWGAAALVNFQILHSSQVTGLVISCGCITLCRVWAWLPAAHFVHSVEQMAPWKSHLHMRLLSHILLIAILTASFDDRPVWVIESSGSLATNLIKVYWVHRHYIWLALVDFLS